MSSIRPSTTQLKTYIRSGSVVTEKAFVNEMADLMGEDYEIAKKAFDAYNNLILQHMALEDWIHLPFGTVGGYTKEPKKITGYYSVLQSLQDPTRKGWTVAKSGFPFIIWSKEAEFSTVTHPGIYYTEWVPQKYTTKAYYFRKELGYKEIPEYEGLSEEKILEICAKADIQLYGKKTKKEKKSDEVKKEKLERRRKIESEKEIRYDIEKQLKAGKSKEEIVVKTYEQILEEKYNEWKKKDFAEVGVFRGRGYELPEKLLKQMKTEKDLKEEKYKKNDSPEL